MIIYTVVGKSDSEGIAHLGLSFTSKKDALECLAKCNEYNKAYHATESYRPAEWYDRHPLSTSSSGCHCWDSYDVIEHELIGGDV